MSSRPSFAVCGRTGRFRAYKYGNGVWYVDYRQGKRRVRESLGVRTRPDAERAVRALDAKLARASDPSLKPTGPSKPPPTVRKVVDEFLQWCEARRLAPTSISRYRAATDAFMRYCAKVRMARADEMTLSRIEMFLKYRIQDEGRAEKTAYNDAIILKGLFKFASHPGRGLLTCNPAEGWEVREPVQRPAYCFTQTEVDTLMAGCREWIRPIVVTLAYEGLRIGELSYLRPVDVDLDGGFIHVRAREGWNPKGRRDRAVPIHDLVRDVVATRLTGEWVFLSPKGRQVRENHTLRAFKADRDRLGIHQGTLHSLRHFFVSFCAERGVPLLTCMAWVGHKDAEMVQHYYHLHDDVSRRAMEKLSVMGPEMKLNKMA